MPSIKGKRQLEIIYLPSTKDEPNPDDRAWVKVRTRLTWGDMTQMKKLNEEDQAGFLLESLIEEWNLTDDETAGSPIAAITAENINLLVDEDIEALFTTLGEKMQIAQRSLPDDQKKSLPSTSATALTGTSQTPQVSPTTIIPITS